MFQEMSQRVKGSCVSGEALILTARCHDPIPLVRKLRRRFGPAPRDDWQVGWDCRAATALFLFSALPPFGSINRK